jgi:TRAP-type C4-dicarboxylate transport system permease small subunit
MRALSDLLKRLLEWITVALLIALAVIVVAAVVARYAFNSSFIWYDEIASVLLAWITFYGAAYAAIRRRHLGFEGILLACPVPLRLALFVAGELIVYSVFAILAYAGWFILGILGSETLVSVRWVPLWFTQSVVPIGAVLFILAQLLSTPEALARLRAGRSAEDEEIAEEIARAEAAAGGRR